MRSKKYQMALAALALPALVTSVSAMLRHPWLPTVGLAAMLLMIAVISLDTNRRSRSRFAARPAPEPKRPATVVPEDLLGTIRLLQAQYVGRLDRSQAALEEATAALVATTEHRSPGTDEVSDCSFRSRDETVPTA